MRYAMKETLSVITVLLCYTLMVIPVTGVTEPTADPTNDPGKPPIDPDELLTNQSTQLPLPSPSPSPSPSPPVEEPGVTEPPRTPVEDHGVTDPPKPPVEDPGVTEPPRTPVEDRGVTDPLRPPVEDPGVTEPPRTPVEDPGVTDPLRPPVEDPGVTEPPRTPVEDRGVTDPLRPPVEDPGVTEPPILSAVRGCPSIQPTNESRGLACDISLNCDVDENCSGEQMCCPDRCGTFSCTQSVTVCQDREGGQYQMGESFLAQDGCNLCTCLNDGLVRCTDQDCPTNIACPFISDDNTLCSILTCTNDSSCGEGQRCCPAGQCVPYCMTPVSICRSFNGTVYQVGNVFPLGDGCNNCTCLESGRVTCTLFNCFGPCFGPPLTDRCRSPGTKYYYDARRSACLNFTGGCEGGEFSNARDCYNRCDPQNVCNAGLPSGDGNCAMSMGWTFDGRLGRCMETIYYECDFRSGAVYNVFTNLKSCLVACVDPSSTIQTCPAGISPVLCFADPCEVSTCPNFPTANCVPNFCGGCNAHYFSDDGNNVTDRCVTRNTCEDGSLMVRCFVNPCDVSSCPQYPEARCVPNNCGNCSHKYLDADNRDMTHMCKRAIPVPITEAVCPYLDKTLGGVCSQFCSGQNNNCSGNQLCCSNGCGTSCMDPAYVPYHNIPPVCPQTELRAFFGVCPRTDRPCSVDSDCETAELCCRDRCGRRCMDAVRSNTPCFAALDRVLETDSLFSLSGGTFLPTCTFEGRFDPIQCNESTQLCWCVNRDTGQPLSSYSPRGTRPNCQTCSFDGSLYEVGETFSSYDGCNTCQCSDNGQVLCSTNECVDPCTLPPDPGPCRASIRAFHYDQRSGRCLPFTYGGCEGNANKFRSVRDCLMNCDVQDPCLLEPVQCDTEALSFSFNIMSGQCEKRNLGVCDRNGNSFPTGRGCEEQCSPGSPGDRCLDIICGQLVCPRGTEMVQDDQHCCPYCSPIVQCEDNEYRCSDGTCIPIDQFCDRIKDCSDGADEKFCDKECEFSCGDRTCIRRSQVCDGIIDCRDGADIRNCTRDILDVYYLKSQDIPMFCPETIDSLGACVQECNSTEDCTGGTICCSNGCGRTCVTGIQEQSLCRSVLRRSKESVEVGIFRPVCNEDGSFTQVQCNNVTGFCWCVDLYSGQPVSEGVRGERPNCRGCRRPNGNEISVGESYRTEDGCNTCSCTGIDTLICTLRVCDTAPCRFYGRQMMSNSTFNDDCNRCSCFAGALTCTRKNCTAVTMRKLRKSVRARFPFSGNYNMIIDGLEDFKREVVRSFLDKYERTLGVMQDQIKDIRVIDGSVVVEMTLEDSNTTSGANVSVLLGQVQQDFEAGVFVIRYENQVLMPSGDFQAVDLNSSSATSLLTWQIGLIVVVVVAVMAIAISVITAVVLLTKSKKSNAVRKGKVLEKGNKKIIDYE